MLVWTDASEKSAPLVQQCTHSEKRFRLTSSNNKSSVIYVLGNVHSTVL